MIRQVLVALALAVLVLNAGLELKDRWLGGSALCSTDTECEGLARVGVDEDCVKP
jgi:hypothetical protein